MGINLDAENTVIEIENISKQIFVMEVALLEGDSEIRGETLGGALSLVRSNLSKCCEELNKFIYR